ncbi:methyltransferase domain-containing protein [bacterium]|nr:methyltransferase domain-containing protein [bacterium]
METKKSHPALAFARARLRTVRVRDEDLQVWMAPDIDSLLTDFIEANQQNQDLASQRCPFGAVLWPSARALWEWLCEEPARFEQVAGRIDDSTFRVIELGCGVGFLSALLAARTQWSITASDYEPAYAEYLSANCKLYGSRMVDFQTLDWCEKAPQNILGRFDLVIACDVLYDDSHLESLPRIARELLKPEGALLLADPQRFRFETALEKIRTHFAKMNDYKIIVKNSDDDSLKSGVINPQTQSTRVEILHCQNPFTSKST